MTAAVAVLAVLAIFAGAAALYLGAANQLLLKDRMPPRISTITGCGALMVALILFLQIAGPAASVFIVMTLTMLLWSLAPVAIAVIRRRRSLGK